MPDLPVPTLSSHAVSSLGDGPWNANDWQNWQDLMCKLPVQSQNVTKPSLNIDLNCLPDFQLMAETSRQAVTGPSHQATSQPIAAASPPREVASQRAVSQQIAGGQQIASPSHQAASQSIAAASQQIAGRLPDDVPAHASSDRPDQPPLQLADVTNATSPESTLTSSNLESTESPHAGQKRKTTGEDNTGDSESARKKTRPVADENVIPTASKNSRPRPKPWCPGDEIIERNAVRQGLRTRSMGDGVDNPRRGKGRAGGRRESDKAASEKNALRRRR